MDHTRDMEPSQNPSVAEQGCYNSVEHCALQFEKNQRKPNLSEHFEGSLHRSNPLFLRSHRCICRTFKNTADKFKVVDNRGPKLAWVLHLLQQCQAVF